MTRINISNIIDAKFHDFSILYYNLLHDRIAAYTRINKNEIKLDNTIPPDQFVYGDRVIIILVSGKEIRATVKLHYSLSEVEWLIPQRLIESLGSKSAALESYFSEMVNLIAGALKAELIDMKYTVGISLPISASSYDELVSSDLIKPDRYYAFTACQFEKNAGFVITTVLENEGTALLEYKYQEKQADEDSEFL